MKGESIEEGIAGGNMTGDGTGGEGRTTLILTHEVKVIETEYYYPQFVWMVRTPLAYGPLYVHMYTPLIQKFG
jgi:hypothetical protein